MNSLFVTGTDTAVGKTLITGLLGRFLLEKGRSVITQKWIQTGHARNSDDVKTHLRLMKRGENSIQESLDYIRCFAFDFPASPHLSAFLEGKSVSPEKIKGDFLFLQKKFDVVIVEGTGGVLVTYNDKEFVIDIVKELNLSVLIVAQNKLGAINHTLLTIEALQKRNLGIVGIVFNSVAEKTDKIILDDNIAVIRKLSGVKVFGCLPWNEDETVLYKSFRPIGKAIIQGAGQRAKSKEQRA